MTDFSAARMRFYGIYAEFGTAQQL